MAYVSDSFGGRPSDYTDGKPGAFVRFCIDEAALLVLGYAKRDAANKAKEEAGLGKDDDKSLKSKGENKVRVNDEEGFARLKAHSERAKRKAQLRSMG